MLTSLTRLINEVKVDVSCDSKKPQSEKKKCSI